MSQHLEIPHRNKRPISQRHVIDSCAKLLGLELCKKYTVLSPFNASSPLEPEDVPILFPSDLPRNAQTEPLRLLEGRLRDGQCQDALDYLRNNLLVKSRLHTYKKSNARRQGATTRARGKLDRHERKIKLSTARYQRAWQAKSNIVDGVKEEIGWHVLELKDVRMMYDAEEQKKKDKRKLRGVKRSRPVADSDSGSDTGDEERVEGADVVETNPGAEAEGYRTLSWIWMSGDNTGLATDKLLYAGIARHFSNPSLLLTLTSIFRPSCRMV